MSRWLAGEKMVFFIVDLRLRRRAIDVLSVGLATSFGEVR